MKLDSFHNVNCQTFWRVFDANAECNPGLGCGVGALGAVSAERQLHLEQTCKRLKQTFTWAMGQIRIACEAKCLPSPKRNSDADLTFNSAELLGHYEVDKSCESSHSKITFFLITS